MIDRQRIRHGAVGRSFCLPCEQVVLNVLQQKPAIRDGAYAPANNNFPPIRDKVRRSRP